MIHEVCMQSLSYADLYTDPKEIARSLGYGEAMPHPDIQVVLTRHLSEVSTFTTYTFGYRHIEGEVIGNQQVKLDETLFTPRKIITRHLRGSRSFLLLVATVGKEFDGWMKAKCLLPDMLEAFIADTLGSVLVEAIVQYTLQYLETVMRKEGMTITNSYSPGYCGWDISEQALFFSLLPPDFGGISLTNVNLMQPIKSVSALVGVGVGLERKPYGCSLCTMKHCYKRSDVYISL